MNGLEFIANREKNKFKTILKAIIIGIVVAIIVILYRYALSYGEKLCFYIYSLHNENKLIIPLIFIGLISSALIIGKILDREPYIGGSGIPQVKAIMGGYITNRPISVIINKFMGGVIGIVSGLSLGREGPSIQLGAATAEAISNKLKSNKVEKRLLISSGASAGLAAAFNAPLAGVLFSLEEIYKYFSPLVLLVTMTSAIVADFISKQFFGIDPVFEFGRLGNIPLSNYGLLIVLGGVLGISGAVYNKCTMKVQELYGKIKVTNSIKMLIPFIYAGIMGLVFPVVLGGGHKIVEELKLETTILMLVLMLVLKFAFSMISFGSGAPGGIFFPLLIIGGTIGAIFGKVSIDYLGISQEFFYNFIILSMAGYFTAIVRAPITGIILIVEMTGSFSQLLSLTVVSIVAYIVADLLKSTPIYESLLESLLRKNNIKENTTVSSEKVIVANIAHLGSKIENKMIKNVDFPGNILVVSVKRGDRDIMPKGDTVIKAGDEVLVMVNSNDEVYAREFMEELTNA